MSNGGSRHNADKMQERRRQARELELQGWSREEISAEIGIHVRQIRRYLGPLVKTPKATPEQAQALITECMRRLNITGTPGPD